MQLSLLKPKGFQKTFALVNRVIISSRQFSTVDEVQPKKEKVKPDKVKKAPKQKAVSLVKKINKSKLSPNEISDLDDVLKFYDTIQAILKTKPTFSEEELAEHSKIAKEYQRQSQRQVNLEHKDLALKIWLQQEAIKALPEALQIQAKIIDDTAPPRDRPYPIWDTPPIKDFDFRKYMTDDGKGIGGNTGGRDDEDDEEDSKPRL